MQFGKGDTEERCQFLDYHWLFSRTIQEDLLAQYLEQIGQVVCGEIFKQKHDYTVFQFFSQTIDHL